MTPALDKLKSLTAVLLSPGADENGYREATISLSKLFSESVDFNEMDEDNQLSILIKSGKAIAPRWAASCIIDYSRTRKFILGIKEAIGEKFRTNPGKPVTVLYAGTGPFASLLTPLVTVFTPAQLQIVLVEINPVSIRYLRKIIQQFGMEDYIIEVVETDAATWCVPDHIFPDIVVSETMNSALQKEPQVSIVANLLSQCGPNTILIPQLIKVDVCLLGNTMDNPEDIFHLETLLELDAEMAVRIKYNPEEVAAISKGIKVAIAELPPDRFKTLVLNTSIRIFGEHSLGFNESGLTIPQVLMMSNSFKKFPMQLLFQYSLNDNPGFNFKNV